MKNGAKALAVSEGFPDPLTSLLAAPPRPRPLNFRLEASSFGPFKIKGVDREEAKCSRVWGLETLLPSDPVDITCRFTATIFDPSRPKNLMPQTGGKNRCCNGVNSPVCGIKFLGARLRGKTLHRKEVNSLAEVTSFRCKVFFV